MRFKRPRPMAALESALRRLAMPSRATTRRALPSGKTGSAGV